LGRFSRFRLKFNRYSDYFERALWLSRFHRARSELKRNPHIEIEEAPERIVHGFKDYRLKQSQLAMLLAPPRVCGWTRHASDRAGP
jgi:hypothetical protein